MKSLRFKKLWLISEQTRSAFSISFHSKTTLLVGKNHTGKSTLVKHIFRTLGCETWGKSDRWDPLAVSVLNFEYDGTSYSAYRRANVFALKNVTRGILRATTSYKEWTNIIASVFDFRLTLPTHQEKLSQATPPYLLLPFYIDQDGGWTKLWSSFDKLTQFANWKKPLVAYVTGQHPNDYYKAKFELFKARAEAAELSQELGVVQAALVRVKKALPRSTVRLDPNAFKQEIAELLRDVTQLNNDQESLRAKTFEQASEKQSLIAQIGMAKSALKDLEGDLKYLTETKPQETLLCPTCGTEHENGFPVRLELIDDTVTLREIIGELETDLRRLEDGLATNYGRLNRLKSKSREIEEALQTKKGALRLQDVVESQSAEVVRTAFSKDMDWLKKQLEDRESNVTNFKDKVAQYDLPERTKEINEYYSAHMELFASELGVADLREDLKKRPDAALVASGSALPRSILAYQFAVLHTAKEKGDAKLFPIVVDSPNQQGQDAEHLAQMLKFIVKRVPAGQQLILAVEENPNLTFEGETAELTRPYGLLDANLYEAVSAELHDLVEAVNAKVDARLASIHSNVVEDGEPAVD
jgi:hypothetical protein